MKNRNMKVSQLLIHLTTGVFNDFTNIGFSKNGLYAGGGVPVNGPSANQLQQQYDPGIVFNQMVAPDWNERVVSTSDRYNYALPLLIERKRRLMWGEDAMPRRVLSRLGQFTRYGMGEMTVQAAVASATTSGPNIIITWQNPAYWAFRTDDRVQNNPSSNVNAKVVSPNFQAGSITIAPIDDSTPLNLSDWNNVGMVVNVIGDAYPYKSQGRAPISQIPTPTYNYTQTFRDSVEINRLDDYLTYPKTDGGNNWVKAQYGLTLAWLNKRMGYSAIYGQRGLLSATGERSFMGLDASIQDPVRGGVPTSYYSYPTVQDFESYWMALANKRAQEKTNFVHITGRGGLKLIQDLFTTNLIIPVGKNNTLETIDGVPIKGLDAYTFAYAGTSHIFIMDPLLNDIGLPNNSAIPGLQNYSQASLSFYTIDTGSLTTAENGMSIPAMEYIYFGEKMMRLGIIRGMAQNPFFMNGINSESIEITTSEDLNSAQMLMDGAYDFWCSNMGYFKPGF